MRNRNNFIFASLMAAGIAVALGSIAVVAATPAETIKQRQALMKELGGNMKAMYGFTQGQGGETVADIAKRAEVMKGLAAQIPGLFPPGTSRYVAKSSAKPEIWENWAAFEAAANSLADQAGKMAEVAAGGDNAAIATQFEQLGSIGCGGCHSKFREK